MNKLECPPANMLSDYALGHLDDSTLSEIDRHLRQCHGCQQRIATVWSGDRDSLISDLRAAAVPIGSASGGSESSEPQFETVRDYRLLRLLGRGGMGSVYLAKHERIGKLVALKLIKSERLQEEKTKARFEREMRAMGALEHANLVKAIDAGEHEGRMYLAMEYVDGASTGEIVRAMGQLSRQDACEIVRQAAVGLQYAFEKLEAFVHRDIKPSNLLLGRNGEVKVADLGLVRAGNLFDDDVSLTATHSFVGTLDYTAPEQIDHVQDVDIRADIYALGATLYKLLTGQVPFSGERYDSFSDKVHGISKVPPTPINQLRPELPARLARLIHLMLAKKPSKRPTTPGQVADALEPFCESADLERLLEQKEAASSDMDELTTSTFAFVSSAQTDTRRSIDLPAPVPAPDRSQVDVERPIESIEAPADSLQSDVSQPPKKSKLGPPSIPRWTVAVGAGILAVLTGIVLIIPTGKGNLTVDLQSVDEAKLHIRRFNGGVINDGFVVKKGADNTLELRAGEYEVKLLDANRHSLTLSTDRVTITKNADAHVEIFPSEVQPDRSEAPPNPTPSSPDPPSTDPAGPPLDPPSDTPLAFPQSGDDPIQIEPAPNLIHRSLVSAPPMHLSPWKPLPDGHGRYVMITRGHAGQVHAVTLHPDESRFATAGDDRVLRIWSTKGELLRAIPMRRGIQALAWSPDGQDLVAAVEDELLFFDPSTGKTRDKLAGYARGEWITSVEWSPDGESLLVCDGVEVEVVHVGSVAFKTVLVEGCQQAKWLSDRETLVYVANWDTQKLSMVVANLETGSKRLIVEFPPDRSPGHHVAWWLSPNRDHVAIANQSRRIEVIHLATGASRIVEESVVSDAFSVAWQGDDGLLVLSGASGPAWLTEVELADTARKKNVTALPKVDGHYPLASRGKVAVFTHKDGAITVTQPNATPVTIRGAYGQKSESNLFWRDQGRKLCLPEVEFEVNNKRAHHVIDVVDASHQTHRMYAGPAFPNVDPLVTTLVENERDRFVVWNVNTRLIEERGNIRSENYVGMSPTMTQMVRQDSSERFLDLPDGESIPLGEVGFSSHDAAWSPNGDAFAFPFDYAGQLGIVQHHKLSRYISESWRGRTVVGLRWPHANRLTLAMQGGDLWTIEVKENGECQAVMREDFDNDGGVAISDRHVAFFVGRVARIHLFNRRDMKHTGTIQVLPRHQLAVFGADGRYVANRQAEAYLTYVVDNGSTIELANPSSFHEAHGSNQVPEMDLYSSEPVSNDTSTSLATPADALTQSGAMSPYALVDHPASLDGVQSWTIETVSHRGSLAGCDYSPDGSRIATSCHGDTAIRIYDMHGGAAKLHKIIVAPERGSLCWIDNTTVVSAGRQRLFVWDTSTGKLKQVMNGTTRWSFDRIRFLPSIRRLLAVRNTLDSPDSERAWRVDLIDPQTFEATPIISDVQHHEALSVDVHPDGKLILGVLDQGDASSRVLHVWRSSTQRAPLRTANNVDTARWSPDGGHLAISGKGKLIIVDHQSFTRAGAKLVHRRPPFSSDHPFEDMSWSRDGRTIAAWDAGNQFLVISTDSEHEDGSARKGERAWWVTWGNKYLAHCTDRGPMIMNPQTGVVLQDLRSTILDSPIWSKQKRELAKDEGVIVSFHDLQIGRSAWSPSGRYCFSFGYEQFVMDNKTGGTVEINLENIANVAFSRDDQWFVAATNEHDPEPKVRVWRLESPARLFKTFPMADYSSRLSMADNGTFAVTGSAGTYLYDLNDLEAEPVRIGEGYNFVSLSPDAKLMVTDTDVMEVSTSASLSSFEWQPSAVIWTSNSQFSAVSVDQTIRHYNADTGDTSLRDFSDWDRETQSHAFNANGSHVMWQRVDRSVRIIDYLTEETPSTIRVHLQQKKWLDVSKTGHWTGAPHVTRQLRYVAKLGDGSQITLTQPEFEQRFEFTNDPSAVWSPDPGTE